MGEQGRGMASTDDPTSEDQLNVELQTYQDQVNSVTVLLIIKKSLKKLNYYYSSPWLAEWIERTLFGIFSLY